MDPLWILQLMLCTAATVPRLWTLLSPVCPTLQNVDVPWDASSVGGSLDEFLWMGWSMAEPRDVFCHVCCVMIIVIIMGIIS
jgi:hypothetical protein